jgi:hypothetical protein
MGSREPTEESAWRFYGRLLRHTPRAIWEAGTHFGTLVWLVLGVLFLFNRHLAESVSTWHGISPAWAVVPFGLLILMGLLRANHDAFKELRKSQDERPQIGQYVHQQFFVGNPEQMAELVKKVSPVPLNPPLPEAKEGSESGEG